jgi:cytoskeletal protein CcmA (bactofilin family)
MAFQDLKKAATRDQPSAAPAMGGVGTLTAFIDQGSEFSGKLSFKDTVRIDGRFEGEIASENTLIVGESGHVEATIHSEVVIVSGEVRGDIHAKQQITLHKNARVFGKLHTQTFVVEEGARFSGEIDMGGNAQPDKPAARPPEDAEAKK